MTAAGRTRAPNLSYEYDCKSCGHSWSVSQGDCDHECPKCDGRKVKAPNRRGTYKYECKCGHKWKKHHSRGGSTLCPNPECSNRRPIFPYKFEPDPPRRMFGEFFCEKCDRNWSSGNAWEGRGQQCQECLTNIQPHTLHPLRPPRHLFDQKPHREDLCERCKELGHSCRNQPSYQYDEESVISTSDSSVVSDGPPDDTTPVPSEGGSDICSDIDELTEEIKHFELTKN